MWQAKKELEIKRAPEEPKARAHKRKIIREPNMNQPLWICKLQMCNHEGEIKEEAPMLIITIKLGNNRLITCAFIDSGANYNIISYELFQQLGGYNLHDSQALVRSFTYQSI